MKVISVLDTTIADYNIGNQIIMQAVVDILEEIFPEMFLYRLQYLEKFYSTSLRYLRKSDEVFFGGTNSLSSNMNKYKQMGFTLFQALTVRKLILLGVGWWQYQKSPNFYTKIYLTNLLHPNRLHSVRDQYTAEKLNAIGIQNVINTCCPTTWSLTPEHCASIPSSKAENVVMTLTDYNKDPISDLLLIKTLIANYRNVYFWIQGVGDFEYLKRLDSKLLGGLSIIPPQLSRYDQVLLDTDCDYIGTRLHAGIRALQKGRRSLILAVDNRAIEISKDTKLNVKDRGNIRDLESFIQKTQVTEIHLPSENIATWKSQFRC